MPQLYLNRKDMDSLPVSILAKLGLSILKGFDLIRVDGREADNTFEIALIHYCE
jgi:hypothetical protein